MHNISTDDHASVISIQKFHKQIIKFIEIVNFTVINVPAGSSSTESGSASAGFGSSTPGLTSKLLT